MRHTAIRNIYPQVAVIDDSAGCFDDSGNIVAIDETIISQETQRLEKQDELLSYRRLRAAEYPPVGDQLDALWKGGDAATEMLLKVQAVKAKYPKPTE